jgi:transglutaminase-like putative cysteine protease
MKMKKDTARWWDFWSTLLLMAALMTTAARLLVTDWTIHLAQVVFMMLLAFALGLVLGFSRHRKFMLAFYASSYGLVVITWLLAAIDTSSLLFRERAISIVQRLLDAGRLFRDNQEIYDPILFVLFLLVIFWILGIFSSLNLIRRGSIWRSILPIGAAILIINHYDLSNKTGGLLVAAYLFFALLFIGRITFLRRRKDWQKARINLPAEAAGNITRIVILTGTALLFFAWLLPVVARQDRSLTPAWRSIESNWIRIRERFSGAFEGIESGEQGEIVLYADQFNLGTKTRGGESVLFVVESNIRGPQIIRNYWYVRSYDHYQDGAWSSTLDERVDVAAGKYLPVYPEWNARAVSKFLITTSIPKQGSLIAPQYTFWVGRYVQVYTGNAVPPSMDVGYIRTVPPLQLGESYEVRAWINQPTQKILRDAPTEYPVWIQTRYLEIPDGLDSRIPDLAQEITAKSSSVFDSVVAITQYLRKNMTYQKEIQNPPKDADPAAWFLLDYKTGYCNYYASAEVMLLRSLGIPARVAVGYAEGKYLIDKGYYEVRGEDSHAWPEVYFSGWGWVPFEPTTSQPDIALPSGEEVITENDGSRVAGQTNPNPQRFAPGKEFLEGEQEDPSTYLPVASRWDWRLPAAILTGCIGILALLWIFIFPRIRFDRIIGRLQRWLEKIGAPVPLQLERWRHYLAMTPIERAYMTLDWALKTLHQEQNAAETPTEKLSRFSKILPGASQPATDLVEEFQCHQFSPRQADIRKARNLGWKIRWAIIRRQIRIWLALELNDSFYR